MMVCIVVSLRVFHKALKEKKNQFFLLKGHCTISNIRVMPDTKESEFWLRILEAATFSVIPLITCLWWEGICKGKGVI